MYAVLVVVEVPPEGSQLINPDKELFELMDQRDAKQIEATELAALIKEHSDDLAIINAEIVLLDKRIEKALARKAN